MNKKGAYATIILSELLLVFITFKRFFEAPLDQMFSNVYDGFKNYLTYHSYILQEDFGRIYHQMNYPFGDFISFTDNTPLVAVFYKATTKIFPSLIAYDIAFYNFFCLLGIILTALVLYKIFQLLEINNFLALTFSVLLPWCSPQLERLFSGHFNLSFTWIIPLALWILIYSYKRQLQFPNVKNRKIYAVWISYFLLITYIHIYYTAVVAVFAFSFTGIWYLSDIIKNKRIGFNNFPFKLLIALLVAVAISLLSIWGLDPKPELRQAFAEGYGYDAWKLSFHSLYSSYSFIPYSKWLGMGYREIPYETYMYLGTAIWGSMIVFFMTFKQWKQWVESPYFFILLLLLISGFICLFVGFGEGGITRFLNPFYYAHFFTDRIEQFRCLGRFGWGFFWAAQIFMVYYLHALWNNKKLKILVFIVLLLQIADTYFYIQHFRTSKAENFLSDKIISVDTQEILEGLEFKNYQAILPIPFYHVGCENYDYTIDPLDDGFFRFTSMVSLATGLPNMGSKMSRTPVVEAQSLLSLFDESIGLKDYVLGHMVSDQPVLVVLDKAYYNQDPLQSLPNRAIPKRVIENGESFVKNLKRLKANDRFELYEWIPKMK